MRQTSERRGRGHDGDTWEPARQLSKLGTHVRRSSARAPSAIATPKMAMGRSARGKLPDRAESMPMQGDPTTRPAYPSVETAATPAPGPFLPPRRLRSTAIRGLNRGGIRPSRPRSGRTSWRRRRTRSRGPRQPSRLRLSVRAAGRSSRPSRPLRTARGRRGRRVQAAWCRAALPRGTASLPPHAAPTLARSLAHLLARFLAHRARGAWWRPGW